MALQEVQDELQCVMNSEGSETVTSPNRILTIKEGECAWCICQVAGVGSMRSICLEYVTLIRHPSGGPIAISTEEIVHAEPEGKVKNWYKTIDVDIHGNTLCTFHSKLGEHVCWHCSCSAYKESIL